MDGTLAPPALEARGLDKEALKRSFLEWLVYSVGRDTESATRRDWFQAVALTVRDRLVQRWMETSRGYAESGQKRVYYLSLEFLIGRLLGNGMINLGVMEACREALADLGLDLNDVMKAEPDAALGNGGLGRLAACFLDSMATLGIAGMGYGIRYEYGLFEQHLDRGWQIEYPEDWLKFGNPWEFARPEMAFPIDFYGRVEEHKDASGRPFFRWQQTQRVLAVAYDTPIVGWRGKTINTLRLWSAKPSREFDLAQFNKGDYLRAVEDKIISENLSRVLYPNDSTPMGQELRLKQEYFFTSASLQDILRRHRQFHETFDALPDKIAIQLNDTHPAIAVPELMRLLIDRYGLEWDRAWELTSHCISYTNHTLLPEALETWPVRLLERVLPRHLQIIFEINARFLKTARTLPPGDLDKLARLSMIDEHGDRRVRMSTVAFVGSTRVNGVSALHTELMKETVFSALHAEFPDRIVNVTNGITPRRWLMQANRRLASLIDATIGEGWRDDLDRLADLAPYADDAGFRDEFAGVKRRNKGTLATAIDEAAGIKVSTEALFDVQVKRIHEYKRQLLNLLHTVALWQEMHDAPTAGWTPRVKVLAGKAAPSYSMAKLIIKLANDIGRTVNADPAMRDLLKVVFLPNYNVTLAERIIPAADLSEQISTAGLEASGTGNMKFALNGALTIGTLDGANVEIAERVGRENIFIFGLTAEEVADLRAAGKFDPNATIEADPRLKRAVAAIESGVFSPEDPGRFQPIVDALRRSDFFLVTADFASYLDTQRDAGKLYRDRAQWMKKAILNTASVAWFSSDRSVREYAETIWRVLPPPLAQAAE